VDGEIGNKSFSLCGRKTVLDESPKRESLKKRERSLRREAFERSGCVCPPECSYLVSITFLTIKEFSLDDSRALLLIIHLNRK